MKDLKAHLIRHIAFSRATFGPGRSEERVLDHMKKEMQEIEESGGSPYEWVDVVILALDGFTRSIKYPEEGTGCATELAATYVAQNACDILEWKQGENEMRDWPDWRTADPNKAIEHIREEAA